jgi:hypothetical protein
LLIVKPETVIGWHGKGFPLFWTWKVHRGQPGRPPVSKRIRQLIRRMSRENPLFGLRLASTVTLLKLGVDIGETSASHSERPMSAGFISVREVFCHKGGRRNRLFL